MIDRALDRLCAWVFGPVQPIDHDAIDVLIDVVGQEDHDAQGMPAHWPGLPDGLHRLPADGRPRHPQPAP